MRTTHLLIMRLAAMFVAWAIFVPGSLLYAQKTALAVVDFEAIGISQTESVALSNRLRNEFFRLGTFKVVDRGLMEAILHEQDIQQTGCTSNECLVEVGKLLGVQQMVGGSISRVGTILSVSARLVDVETGEVLNVSDYDLVGGLEEMLTEGMYEVALTISGREDVSMTAAEQPTPQPDQQVADQREMTVQESLPVTPVRSTQEIPHRWQSRFGGSDGDVFSVAFLFSYDLTRKSNLWGIQLQRVVSGGFMYREGIGGGYYEVEEIAYGMLEYHKRWSSTSERLVGAVYTGIGLGYNSYDYHDLSSRVSGIFAIGNQIHAKLPILPYLVADIRLVATPYFGSSFITSIGARGSFTQLAAIWGAIILSALALGG